MKKVILIYYLTLVSKEEYSKLIEADLSTMKKRMNGGKKNLLINSTASLVGYENETIIGKSGVQV